MTPIRSTGLVLALCALLCTPSLGQLHTRGLRQEQESEAGSILETLGLDLSPFAGRWETPQLDQAREEITKWFEDVRQSAQESLQGFPLVAELLNSGATNENTPLGRLVEALGLDTSNIPTFGGLRGEGIFSSGFLEGLDSDVGSLFSGEPLDGSVLTDIQNAIQGAGGSDTRVGRFLSNLFGAAAGDDQQTLFQNVASQFPGGQGGSIFDQAVQTVRNANGGMLPTLDESFVDQVTQLLDMWRESLAFGGGEQGGILGGSGLFGNQGGLLGQGERK